MIFGAIIAALTGGAWFGAKKWRAYKRKKAENREATVKQSTQKLMTLFKEKTFKVNIAFKDLALSLNKGEKKKIISETTGVIRAGRLTAILGPSGAGKTAFLVRTRGPIDRSATSNFLIRKLWPEKRTTAGCTEMFS